MRYVRILFAGMIAFAFLAAPANFCYAKEAKTNKEGKVNPSPKAQLPKKTMTQEINDLKQKSYENLPKDKNPFYGSRKDYPVIKPTGTPRMKDPL